MAGKRKRNAGPSPTFCGTDNKRGERVFYSFPLRGSRWKNTRCATSCGAALSAVVRPIEFERGKAGIAVGSREKLPGVIDTLIAAVRAGELDDFFSQAAKTGVVGKPRKDARLSVGGGGSMASAAPQ
jgi:hypothetical protein